jgi:hypothetical protein
MHEEAILAWVLELYVSTPDIIENVDRKTLQVLINDVDHLAVFFCKIASFARNFSSSTTKLLTSAYFAPFRY